MNVFAALLAREARYNPDGTFDVLGAGIFAVGVPTLPAAIRLTLVLRAQLDPDEANRLHHLRLRLLDEGDSDVMPAMTVPVILRQGTAPRHYLNIVTDVIAPFPRAGNFRFQVAVDDEAIPFIHLTVTHQPQLEAGESNS
ncbi:MAG: hypothetical protein QOH92_605 [Chloroflexota bacterium]|jgi:hypothetical protein|nr:hypothetical protein [Chloroflexota bacterium]